MIRPVLLASFSALAGLACQSSGPQVDREAELAMHRELSLRYYDMNDLARAENQALQGLEMAEDDAQLQLVLGWVWQRRGDRDSILRAEQLFRELAQEDDYRAVLGLAEALERKGMLFEEAAERLHSGAQVTDAADPKLRVEELHDQAEKAWRDSLEQYERTLELRPDESQALNGAQRVHALLGQSEQSLGFAERLIAQCEQELILWKKQLLRPELSVNEEARLRKLRSSTQDLLTATQLNAASLLAQLGRSEAALEHLESAIVLDGTRPEFYARRGQLLRELGRFGEAIESLQHFLKLSPLAFEHPDIRRAYDLLAECQTLAQVQAASGG